MINIKLKIVFTSGEMEGNIVSEGCKEASKVLVIFYFLTISNFKFYIYSFLYFYMYYKLQYKKRKQY